MHFFSDGSKKIIGAIILQVTRYRIALHHDCSLNAVALKATIIIIYPANQLAEGGGTGREIRDFEQTFAIGRVVELYNVHSRGRPPILARVRRGEAERFAAQSAPGILTHLIQSIISRGTFSPSVLLPTPIVPFQPLPNSSPPPDSRISFMYAVAPTHFHVNTCVIYIRRGTFIPPKSIIPVNIAVHVRFAMEITNTWVLVDVYSLDGHCVAARV